MKFLMCQPDFFQVQYEINPWMDLEKPVDNEQVTKEWENLKQTILNCGATIELISPVPSLPDMVFTANAGLFYKQKIFLSQFKFKERRGEENYFLKWFEQAGYEVIYNKDSPYSFEGAGDALPINNSLFAAFGFRSDRAYYAENKALNGDDIVFCDLVDPYFYHLDTCFCPLDDKRAICYLKAFSQASQREMEKRVELIPVSELEAKRFACNAVVINKNIILPTGCPELTSELAKRGFTVYSCDMHEFLKAGGACKCLTMRID